MESTRFSADHLNSSKNQYLSTTTKHCHQKIKINENINPLMFKERRRTTLHKISWRTTARGDMKQPRLLHYKHQRFLKMPTFQQVLPIALATKIWRNIGNFGLCSDPKWIFRKQMLYAKKCIDFIDDRQERYRAVCSVFLFHFVFGLFWRDILRNCDIMSQLFEQAIKWWI